MARVLALAALVLLAAAAVSARPSRTFKGESADGVTTTVTVDGDGKPTATTISFKQNRLPDPAVVGNSDLRFEIKDSQGVTCFPAVGHEWNLKLPEIPGFPFDHVLFNYNPIGHPPPMVYTVEHFDLHWYTISSEKRLEVPPAPSCEDRCTPPGIGVPQPVDCANFDRLSMPLPADSDPGFPYLDVGAVEPEMGNHLINVAAPEFNGQPFTHTWLYGKDQGQLTYWEPMITVEYLEGLAEAKNREAQCFDIPNRANIVKLPVAGYYPTKYCIRYAGGKAGKSGHFEVSLVDFEYIDPLVLA